VKGSDPIALALKRVRAILKAGYFYLPRDPSGGPRHAARVTRKEAKEKPTKTPRELLPFALRKRSEPPTPRDRIQEAYIQRLFIEEKKGRRWQDIPPAELKRIYAAAKQDCRNSARSPKNRGRERRDWLIVKCVAELETLGYKPTRTDPSIGHDSGCAIVANCLPEFGIHDVTEEGVKKIWSQRAKI
jgi:hypothetical protein